MSKGGRKPFKYLSESGKRKRLAVNRKQADRNAASTTIYLTSDCADLIRKESNKDDEATEDYETEDVEAHRVNNFDEQEPTYYDHDETDGYETASENNADLDFFYDSESEDEEVIVGPQDFFQAPEFSEDVLDDEFLNFEKARSLNVVQLLITWALMYKVKMNALSSLLKILKQFPSFSDLPKDARTLLGTPLTEHAKVVDDGEYYHFGLVNTIGPFLKLLGSAASKVQLCINIDGLPLYKSSNGQLWPILVSIVGIPKKVFCIGAYFGQSKPEDMESFLGQFIDELHGVILSGIEIDPGKILEVAISSVICDAPAKALILGCKGHSGYSSCTRCTQKGKYVDHKVIFPETNCTPRTHQDFLNKTDTDFHHKPSVFERLPGVDMVRTFVLDYMHLVLLGVTRTMMLIWVFGKAPFKAPAHAIVQISEELFKFRAYIPAEFVRKPRHLTLLRRFKATEFRQFLLYTGPVILATILDPVYYENFLVLVVAMRILLCPKLVAQPGFIQYARSLLVNFVESYKLLYSESYITHNFHNLIHLADDAETFGSLDSVSAFRFENYLQKLKSLVRKPSGVLAQIIRRVGEINGNEQTQMDSKPVSENEEVIGKVSKTYIPFDDVCEPHYSSIDVFGFHIANNLADSCVGTAGDNIIVVEGISFSPKRNCLVVVGREYLTRTDFFTGPCKSSILGIHQVSNLSALQCWPVSDITTKYMRLPFRSEFVVLPILHADKE